MPAMPKKIIKRLRVSLTQLPRLKVIAVIVVGLTSTYAPVAFAEYMPDGRLTVCQDPNNLPFSNAKGEGYENKIAELFAKKLGWELDYYSFPQRVGYLRNTLKFKLPGENYRCDLLIGIPFNHEQVSTTLPYFRSTYVLVLADHGHTANIQTENQFLMLPATTLHSLRIGIFDRSPATSWLVKNQLVKQAIPYPTLNADPAQYPGEIIERDLAAGKLDAAIVWGPIAGYFVSRVTQQPLVVVPLASTTDTPLDFAIAMGVRAEDKSWKLKVQQFIFENHSEIVSILKSYNVPLLEN